jgi:putative transposase
MEYRRAKVTGGTYFFTLVTHHRRSFLCEADSIDLLRRSFKYVMQRHPFKIDAAVILPEHLHCIWTLPEGDSDYSMRWRLIKTFFSRRCGQEVRGEVSISRRHKKEQAVWQRRFWEHCIRDEQDWSRHVEYIHYNPVRHGLVRAPRDWKYSSFHRFVREGKYDAMWGSDTSLEMEDGFE